MVRAVGLEPTLLSEPDFESGASTSSTTPAQAGCSLRQARLVACGVRSGQSGSVAAARSSPRAFETSLLRRRDVIPQILAKPDPAGSDVVHHGKMDDEACPGNRNRCLGIPDNPDAPAPHAL